MMPPPHRISPRRCAGIAGWDAGKENSGSCARASTSTPPHSNHPPPLFARVLFTTFPPHTYYPPPPGLLYSSFPPALAAPCSIQPLSAEALSGDLGCRAWFRHCGRSDGPCVPQPQQWNRSEHAKHSQAWIDFRNPRLRIPQARRRWATGTGRDRGPGGSARLTLRLTLRLARWRRRVPCAGPYGFNGSTLSCDHHHHDHEGQCRMVTPRQYGTIRVR